VSIRNTGTEQNPIYPDFESPEFWRERLKSADNPKMAMWYCVGEDRDIRRKSQMSAVRNALKEYEHIPKLKILDAGCGVGELIPLLPVWDSIEYTGVDISPDFINVCRSEFPDKHFTVGNLRSLHYPDNHFDICIAISVQGPIQRNVGYDAWNVIERELLRVAGVVYLLNIGLPTVCEKVTAGERTFL